MSTSLGLPVKSPTSGRTDGRLVLHCPVCEDDVRELRHQGFDDRAIHDICSETAYFAFVNRIADGLGVELERGFDECQSGAD
jgi:hypothetical protein